MITADPTSSVTLFEQVRRQFLEQIETGELIAGTKLPTVRALAEQIHVAPYTVARVYRTLEADGFVETRGRNGTFVKGRSGTAEELLQVDANAYATRARELGIPASTALEYIAKSLGESS